MAERLTKKALKDELTRRIVWFEKSFGFHDEMAYPSQMNDHMKTMYGRYFSLLELRFQIENGVFIGGFAC